MAALALTACGSTDSSTGSSADRAAGGASSTGGAFSYGSGGSSTVSSGGASLGGKTAIVHAGAGGANSASDAAAPGTGGAALDCSTVGCGPPPRCGEACSAPCGCCPCAEGERNGDTVCQNGCYAPLPDAGPTCDPAAEVHQKKYLGTSAAACASIRYTCPDNTTPFQNACGCGCAQNASCPEWFNCMPTPGLPSCDQAMIQKECPYSGFAY